MNVGNRVKLKDFFKRPFRDDLDTVIPNEIIVVSPYISRDALEDTLSPVESWKEYPQVTIICSWRTSDLLSGASDINVYKLCKENGWKLRVNSDMSTHKIHLKAYLAQCHIDGNIVGQGMIGSANLTNSGLDSNIEYLHPVTTSQINNNNSMALDHYNDYFPGRELGSPSLLDAIKFSIAASLEVDDEVFKSMKKHIEDIGPQEKEIFPKWSPPEPVSELSDMAEYILTRMPSKPTLNDLISLESIQNALDKRGLRFGETREYLKDILPADTSREVLNQKTNQVIQEIVQSSGDFDIQKRYGTDCLVWKIHHILNEEIMSNLKPYLGKPIRDIGLEKELWGSDTLGSKSIKISEVCYKLLPIEIRDCVQRLSTWQGTLRLTKYDKALYPRPFGERLQFTTNDGELIQNVSPSTRIDRILPEKRIRHELWLPAFCLFEAPKGAKLGDVILRGLGLWESGQGFVASMGRDFNSDIEILSAQSNSFFENPFRKASETEVIHTKVAAQGGKTGFPLGHPERPMSRYLNTNSLTEIALEILCHDN